jgi:hypothetical protein
MKLTYKRKERIFNVIFGIGFWSIVFVLLFGVSITSQLIKRETVFVRIIDKPDAQMRFTSSSLKYRFIVVGDKETYEIRNSFWNMKWDKSDRYYRLQAGKLYKAKVCGFGNGMFTTYRNILDFEEVKE